MLGQFRARRERQVLGEGARRHDAQRRGALDADRAAARPRVESVRKSLRARCRDLVPRGNLPRLHHGLPSGDARVEVRRVDDGGDARLGISARAGARVQGHAAHRHAREGTRVRARLLFVCVFARRTVFVFVDEQRRLDALDARRDHCSGPRETRGGRRKGPSRARRVRLGSARSGGGVSRDGVERAEREPAVLVIRVVVVRENRQRRARPPDAQRLAAELKPGALRGPERRNRCRRASLLGELPAAAARERGGAHRRGRHGARQVSAQTRDDVDGRRRVRAARHVAARDVPLARDGSPKTERAPRFAAGAPARVAPDALKRGWRRERRRSFLRFASRRGASPRGRRFRFAEQDGPRGGLESGDRDVAQRDPAWRTPRPPNAQVARGGARVETVPHTIEIDDGFRVDAVPFFWNLFFLVVADVVRRQKRSLFARFREPRGREGTLRRRWVAGEARRHAEVQARLGEETSAARVRGRRQRPRGVFHHPQRRRALPGAGAPARADGGGDQFAANTSERIQRGRAFARWRARHAQGDEPGRRHGSPHGERRRRSVVRSRKRNALERERRRRERGGVANRHGWRRGGNVRASVAHDVPERGVARRGMRAPRTPRRGAGARPGRSRLEEHGSGRRRRVRRRRKSRGPRLAKRGARNRRRARGGGGESRRDARDDGEAVHGERDGDGRCRESHARVLSLNAERVFAGHVHRHDVERGERRRAVHRRRETRETRLRLDGGALLVRLRVRARVDAEIEFQGVHRVGIAGIAVRFSFVAEHAELEPHGAQRVGRFRDFPNFRTSAIVPPRREASQKRRRRRRGDVDAILLAGAYFRARRERNQTRPRGARVRVGRSLHLDARVPDAKLGAGPNEDQGDAV